MQTSRMVKSAMALALLGSALVHCSDESEKTIAALKAENTKIKARVAALEATQKELQQARTELESKNEEIKQQTEQRLVTLRKLLTKFKKVIKAGKLSIKIRRNRMVLALPSAVLFDSGKAELNDKGKETLKEVAGGLANFRKREFQVAGHTDSVKLGTKNPFDSNWHLSTARAVEVVKYLRNNGVRAKNLSAAGYAHHRPVATNNTDKGRSKNRRIEITLMPNLKELPDLSALAKELEIPKA